MRQTLFTEHEDASESWQTFDSDEARVDNTQRSWHSRSNVQKDEQSEYFSVSVNLRVNGKMSWCARHSLPNAWMQKVMMPVKPWCDHMEGFESGLRVWELDVGEGSALLGLRWRMRLLSEKMQLGTYAKSAALRAALLQWCYSSRNSGANPTVSAGNGTSADDDWMQVDSLMKGKGKARQTRKEIARPVRPTRALQTPTHARTVAELDIGRKTAGDQVEEHSQYAERLESQERQREKETRGRCGNESVVSFTNTEYSWRALVQFIRGTVDHGCDNQFRVYKETS